MRDKNAPPPRSLADGYEESPQIELCVRLTNGHFESKILVPLDASSEAKQAFVEAWFNLMEKGLEVHKTVQTHNEQKKEQS